MRSRSTEGFAVPVVVLVAALVAVLALRADGVRAADEEKSVRPHDEILRLEDLVLRRQVEIDSLAASMQSAPEASAHKAILERMYALTDALRQDRDRLRQLRNSVTDTAPASPRPPRAPRTRPGKVIAQGLVQFGEDVEVRTGETVNGDAIIVDGDLWVDGHIEGDAIVLGGNLHLGRRASVTGQAIAFAGNVNTTPGADIGGHVLGLTLMPGNLAGTWPQWVSFVLDIFKLGFLLLVAGLFLAIVPDRMARARDHLGESFLKCFGVGLVVLFGGSFAVGVCIVLLSITFIGIPAALLVTFATGVLLIASLFVGVLLLGDRLQQALKLRRRVPWVSVGLGLLFVMLPELLTDALRVVLPFTNGVLFGVFSKGLALIAMSAGLGALVLSRLGVSETGQGAQATS